MDFRSFRDIFYGRRFFETREVQLLVPGFRMATLTDWGRLGYIRQMKRGVWEMVDERRIFSEKDCYILSRIIEPHSYISLESALRYHDLIPEEVYTTTAVTTVKTLRYETPRGRYSYRRIPERAMMGYMIERHEGSPYRMATREKAIVDFLYFHTDIVTADDHFEMRWNPFSLEGIDLGLMRSYASLYRSRACERRVEAAISYFFSLLSHA